MSTEVEALPSLPAFARPTSLYLPDVPRASSVLDTTSYSPFPTFPGSGKTRDPYGLNAYLLHPNDSLWSYVDPQPQVATSAENQRPVSLDGGNAAPARSNSVRKQRSLSVLRRPSPLGALPPVSAEVSENEEEEPQFLLRRRSSSIGSSPRLSLEEAAAVVAIFREEAAKNTPKPKKSIRKALSKARKSVFGMTETGSNVPPLPSMPDREVLVAPSMSLSSSEDLSPSTPLTTRSSSNYSTASSASSTSSSEGIKTPSEGVPVEIAITGTKLANALQDAGVSKKAKNWSRWLGGKKGKLAPQEANTSGSTTPTSDVSASSTPNSSSPDLLSGLLSKAALTPSPAIVTPPSRTTPLIAPTDRLVRQHTWVADQLRRVSIMKISQLKAPSPHPLALALRRQQSMLPEEVASHIPAGQRVFPMSVNSYQGVDGDLGPAQGGLWLNLAIGGVMIKLDRGEQPESALQSRKSSKRSIVPRPRGVHDFITRLPFEERNIVYYPDNVFSPISMARPGYGVWDLDFSAYILALSEVDDPAPSWSSMSRGSFTTSDEFAQTMLATAQENLEEEQVEMLSSPTFKDFAAASEAALQAISASTQRSTIVEGSTESSPNPSPLPSPSQRPVSSFRNVSARSKASSSSSGHESASEDSDEDDEPLAHLARRRSSVLTRQSESPLGQLLPQQSHSRSLSQPERRADQPLSSRGVAVEAQRKGMSQQAAMDQVARARERREQNLLGEGDRRAESEQIRQLANKRLSLIDLHAPQAVSKHRRSASGSASHANSARPLVNRPPSVQVFHSSPQRYASQTMRAHDAHRRSSVFAVDERGRHLSVSRPDIQRGRSNPEHSSKRYHSFYEQQAASISAPTFHSHPHAHHSLSQQFIPHPHASHRMSMILPQQHMMPQYPQPMHFFPMGVPRPNVDGSGSLSKRSSRMN